MRQPAKVRLKRPPSNAASSRTRSHSSLTHQRTGHHCSPFDRLRDYDIRDSGRNDSRLQAIDRTSSHADDEWNFSQISSAHHESRTGPVLRPHHIDPEPSQPTNTHHIALNLSDLTAIPPALTAETSNASLTQTTIVVKIWINYDPIAQEFYHHPPDRRAASCGRLILSPRQRARIEALQTDQNRGGFQHIRLDIGTPFRPLAHVFVEAMPPELMPPPGRPQQQQQQQQQQQYGPGRSQPRLATSLVPAEAAARLGDLTRELWDALRAGQEMIRDEAPADLAGGWGVLVEDLDRWAGYFLRRPAIAEVRKRDSGLRRYIESRATWGFGSL